MFKEITARLSAQEKKTIFLISLCLFLVSFEFAFIRPAANSLFLHYFHANYLPLAWISSIPLNLSCVKFYSYSIKKSNPFRVFLCSTVIIGLINSFFAFILPNFPQASFCFYLWKELYMLIIFQQLWSLIHIKGTLSQTQPLYGILFGIGGLGSMLGGICTTLFVPLCQSEGILYISAPVYFCLFIIASLQKNLFYTHTHTPQESTALRPFIDGIKLIFSSRHLIFILLIVTCMQMSATVLDFQFQEVLQNVVADKDLRTAFLARVTACTDFFSLFMQIVGTSFVVNKIGSRKAYLTMPIIISVCALMIAYSPIFPLLIASMVTVKTLDFSFFSILKEMLYAPLSEQAKVHAKSIIDVFMHRASRAIASLVILGIQIHTSNTHPYISIFFFGIALMWLLSTIKGIRNYEHYSWEENQ